MKRNYYDNFETKEMELSYVMSGWLDTRGNFYECDWGDHTMLSYDIIREHENWYNEYHKWEQETATANSREFLVKEKNFVLLDCPYCNNKTQVITYNPLKRRTKSQTNKLLELFEYSGNMTMYIVKTFMEN